MNSQDIQSILEFFDIKFRETKTCFYFRCPIHDGDNGAALNLYKSGKKWLCNTHHCEEKYQKNIFGFVRALLYKYYNKNVSYFNAKEYCESILKKEIVFDKINDIDINNLYINNLDFEQDETENFIEKISIPSEYYINRGFDADILKQYEVGDCFDKSTKMYGRAVFPIYNHEKSAIIGYTGRSINDQCNKCQQYHPPGDYCNPYPKWKHLNFSRKNTLFNIWFAKEKIQSTGTVILVESPNCVLKLESFGIKNSVAFIGSSISYDHLSILNMLGVMNIILIHDNDTAGGLCKTETIKKCSGLYNLKIPKLDYHDIDDCPPKYIVEKLIPQIV